MFGGKKEIKKSDFQRHCTQRFHTSKNTEIVVVRKTLFRLTIQF